MRQDYVDRREKMWGLNHYQPHAVGIHPADMGMSVLALIFLGVSIILLLME
jgi:hypothetical protein